MAPHPSKDDVIRLATLEDDHWRLESGVERHKEFPETFWIPDEAKRRSLVRGDMVKVMFDYVYPPDHQGREAGERMWVEIVGSEGSCYIGKLQNIPQCTAEPTGWHDLELDSRIVFLPEHVIDIAEPEDAED